MRIMAIKLPKFLAKIVRIFKGNKKSDT
ncbi:stage V sporulation protein SpoVM [Clostridium perfringens]|uniref:Stage V sporulation protein SpoVM n=1 Tax=Clostridium perfringens TaxID=1502 RepID=A0AAW9I104_CLOPF|nr:stage V sporulation protein SpoVM [Clostridium perfringens]MBI5979070.1 stage V sporulation protein SpoVM [Clostridium perfringens]MBI5989276.1 stage V sporulation protein SpoVM [Clostridium perfringens]MBI6000339.1 stage V sporulation protein SpoVM [Clostridium perfringens]MBI6010609.1 stage V sporulation protein SpoVM [Clostridium perfringens]